MIQIAYFLHVISGLFLIGLAITSYLYLLQKYYKHYLTSDATLRTLVITDALILLPLILLTITTALLIPIPTDHYFSITWIFSSCVYLSLAVACLTANIFIKMYYYYRAKTTGIYKLRPYFHVINIIELALFLAILHDMISKQSWLSVIIQPT